MRSDFRESLRPLSCFRAPLSELICSRCIRTSDPHRACHGSFQFIPNRLHGASDAAAARRGDRASMELHVAVSARCGGGAHESAYSVSPGLRGETTNSHLAVATREAAAVASSCEGTSLPLRRRMRVEIFASTTADRDDGGFSLTTRRQLEP